MDEKQFKEITDLIRGLRVEVRDLKVDISEVKAHLRRQDNESLEVISAFRRLGRKLEQLDELYGVEEEEPLQN